MIIASKRATSSPRLLEGCVYLFQDCQATSGALAKIPVRTEEAIVVLKLNNVHPLPIRLNFTNIKFFLANWGFWML